MRNQKDTSNSSSTLNFRQTALKAKLTDPLRTEQPNLEFYYVFIFLNNNIPVKIGHTQNPNLKNFRALSFDEIKIFPFTSFEVALAFEKKIRYYHTL